METIYRPENVSTRLVDVDEIAAQTGLSHEDLVVFKPERLALHELIIRITADVVVQEGSDESALGRNFRRIANYLITRHLHPRLEEITRTYTVLHDTVYPAVRQALSQTLFNPPPARPAPKPAWLCFWRRNANPPAYGESIQEREHRAITQFRAIGLSTPDSLNAAIHKGLYRVLSTISGNRGYLGPDLELLTRLVGNHVCNRLGSEQIGTLIAPWIETALREAGYPRIPNTERPVLISLKGASAAGKSSLRPMLKRMMEERGIHTDGYATISPDIWRRLLLDYEALGDAYLYAGRLTSHEVIIIDGKLDRYIRSKAERYGAMPHLLVDRFRFDSFSTERISRVLHGTYVKHVDTLYMYFVVTPPHATVERGWERGLQTGRYKAVEDFLDHSVEAYTGMPKILFKWLAYDRPLFRYEFLDNSVPKGTFPRCIARGTQHEINIMDCSVLVDIERYQKINIKARNPDEVYLSGSVSSVAGNTGFLNQCIARIPTVNFIDPETNAVYLRVDNGTFTVVDKEAFAKTLENRERHEIFSVIAPEITAQITALSATAPSSR